MSPLKNPLSTKMAGSLMGISMLIAVRFIFAENESCELRGCFAFLRGQ